MPQSPVTHNPSDIEMQMIGMVRVVIGAQHQAEPIAGAIPQFTEELTGETAF